VEKNDFDFWYLVPKYGMSELSSRTQPQLNSKLFDLYPIISSPMKGISDARLVICMAENNCLGILHRFDTIENRKSMIDKVAEKAHVWGVAIGVENFSGEYEVAKYAVDRGCKFIVTDLANGYIQKLSYIGNQLKMDFPNVYTIGGNVVTREGAEFLNKSGFDMVRVGVGGGSNCQTREITAIGRNNVAATKDCSKSDALIITDGGVTSSGNAVKSFAAGADFIMLGSALAHAEEADNDGTLYGMASFRLHKENGKQLKSIEGFETKITKEKKPLKDIIDSFLWGIKSACTYLGAWHYSEIADRSKFVRIDEEF